MFRSPVLALRATVAACALAAAAPVSAQVFTNTLVGAPTFNRPLEGFGGLSAVGTNVRYRTLSFTAATAGTYSFLMTSGVGGFDTFLFLYQGTFSPGAPLANGVISNDDFNGSLISSGFSTSLATGTTYVLVQTAFSNDGTGAFTTTITGPAPVVTSAAVVPEPATYALVAAGLVGVAGAARRRRSA